MRELAIFIVFFTLSTKGHGDWIVGLTANCEQLDRTNFDLVGESAKPLVCFQNLSLLHLLDAPGTVAHLRKLTQKKHILFFEQDGSSPPLSTTFEDLEPYPWWDLVRLPEAIQILQPLENPIIAVLDSGIDIFHPCLRDRIWQNPHPHHQLCGNDQHGCNTSSHSPHGLGTPHVWPEGTTGYGQPCPHDSNICAHGTHIAGLITGDHSQGLLGSCPHCQILPIKIIRHGHITDSAIIRALRYIMLLIDKGANIRVITASFGRYGHSHALDLMIQYLYYRKGPLIIGAAGNDNRLGSSYPARYTQALTVTAIGSQLQRADYSNYGTTIDMIAPGGDGHHGLWSSVPGYGYASMSGTSQAVPIVAGIAGLLFSANPDFTNDDIRSILTRSANHSIYHIRGNHTFKLQGPQNGLLGTGLVDAYAAVQHPILKKEQASPICGSLPLFWLCLPCFAVFSFRKKHNRSQH